MFDRYDALSFDCYGTLIDWERGIAAALRPWSVEAGLDLDDEQLIAAHAAHETSVQREHPRSPYPEILAETLRRIGADYRRPVGAAAAEAYGASVGDWPAFADSAAALQRLQQRYRLIIVSNVDRASFARSNERLGVEFDLVVTAEDVGAYKPDLAVFDHLFASLPTIGVERSGLLHVAESRYHDHEPARQVGLEAVWIDRRGGRSGTGATAPPRSAITPTWRFESLAAFAAVAVS